MISEQNNQIQIIKLQMSSQINLNAQQNTQKAQNTKIDSQNKQGNLSQTKITAAFDLQTKIRVIIQELISPIVRKITNFNERVQTFQKFFFTNTQRMSDVEEKTKVNEQSIVRLFQSFTKNKQNNESEFIKIEEKQQKFKVQKNKADQDIKQINKRLSTLFRQNENINNQFSNTKKKFLEFSQQMVQMKQEVAWKITKYVEQTAEINTKIAINNEEMKKQYFNITLALQKNKQKYEQIMLNKDKQDSLNQRFQQTISILQTQVKLKGQQLQSLNKKLQEMDTALYAKMKNTQAKLQRKLDELFQSNAKIQQSVLKVDGFSKILQQVRQDSEQIRRQLLKKFEQNDQKHAELVEKQLLSINMNILNYEKSTDKKLRSLNEAQQKNVDFFNQKMQYLKIEIQSQISSKATRMMQQKSKNQSGIATSQFLQLQQKMNKLGLQVKKQINKIQNTFKEVKLQIKHQLEQTKENIDTKIQNTVKAIQQSSGSGVSPQFIKTINQKIQKSMDSVQLKIFEFSKQISEQARKMKQVENMKAQTKILFNNLTEESSRKFQQQQQKISNKVERVLYNLTKMRGDAIIRNQFTDKQIKQLKRITSITQRQISSVFKLFPAIGECINLIMCLIFDAQYQHSKIIQDNLPNANKNEVQFRNVVEGVLYEYMQKKKTGYILYRHKQQKKTQIVKATFSGYIKIWQDLYTNDFKNKSQYIPKTFYNRYVDKNVGRNSSRNSPNKDNSQPINASKELGSNISIRNENSRQKITAQGGSDSETMNKSFHIRKKKKISTIRSKEDLIMVVQEDVKD